MKGGGARRAGGSAPEGQRRRGSAGGAAPEGQRRRGSAGGAAPEGLRPAVVQLLRELDLREVFTRMAVVGDEPKQAEFGLLILARPILRQVFDSQSRKMLVELTVGLAHQPE